MSISPVTFVMATYNGSRFIREALQSVFAQTLLPAEIIVVDDRSSDDICRVVESLRSMSPVPLRLIVMPQNSGGPATPLNQGVRLAETPLVSFLDQDDVMLPEKLADLTAVIEQHVTAGMAFGQTGSIDESGVFLSRPGSEYAHLPHTSALIPAAQAYRWLVSNGHNYGGAGGILIRKSAWSALGGFDPAYRICWDYDFALRLTRKSFDVAYSPTLVFQHREHGTNLGGSIPLHAIEVTEILHRCLKVDLAKTGDSSAWQQLYVYIFEAAEAYRQSGNHAAAFRYYWLASRHSGDRRRGVMGLASVSLDAVRRKLLPQSRWARTTTTRATVAAKDVSP